MARAAVSGGLVPADGVELPTNGLQSEEIMPSPPPAK